MFSSNLTFTSFSTHNYLEISFFYQQKLDKLYGHYATQMTLLSANLLCYEKVIALLTFK